jgi:hypothetical protein
MTDSNVSIRDGLSSHTKEVSKEAVKKSES